MKLEGNVELSLRVTVNPAPSTPLTVEDGGVFLDRTAVVEGTAAMLRLCDIEARVVPVGGVVRISGNAYDERAIGAIRPGMRARVLAAPFGHPVRTADGTWREPEPRLVAEGRIEAIRERGEGWPLGARRVARGEPLEAKAEADGWVECPECSWHFHVEDPWCWTGVRHRRCGRALRIDGAPGPRPVWCVVANIVGLRVHGESGLDLRRGTKHFRPGTKVHCYPHEWDPGHGNLWVTGLARRPRRPIQIVVQRKWLTRPRVKMVYTPRFIDLLSGHWDDSDRSKALAEQLCAELRHELGETTEDSE